MDDVIGWSLFWAARHWFGLIVNMQETTALQKYWKSYDEPRLCCFCGLHIRRDERSVDHIIPRSICWELGLYKLILDERNYRLAHNRCNAKRGNDINDLSKPLLDKLLQLGYSPS